MRFSGLFKGNAFDAAVNRAMSGTGQVGEVAGMQFSKRDVADRLPDDAKAILADLRSRRDDALALARSASEAVNGAISTRTDAVARLSALRADRLAAPDHPEVVRLQAEIDRAAPLIAALRERADAREYRRAQLGSLVENVETWLSRLPSDGAIEPHTGTVKVAKSATVESLREQIGQLRADLHEVRSAPFTSAEAKQRARAAVEALARKGRPDVFGLIERGNEIKWPTIEARNPIFGWVEDGAKPMLNATVSTKTFDVLAYDAWRDPDGLIALLEAEIDEAADDRSALTAEERATKEADLLRRILDVERQEAAAVVAAGGEITHRVDTDPRALLNLSSDLPGLRDQ